jgi:AhpD family alkylhydroperoxidase
MTDTVHDPTKPDANAHDINLGPRTRRAFEEIGRAIFAEGALDSKTKQLIAVGAAHLTQCPYCIDGHAGLARRAGATPQEITESIWVAAEIQAGGTFAHPVPARHSHPDSVPTGRNRDDWSH